MKKARREPASKIARKEKIIEHFKKRVEELGIHIMIWDSIIIVQHSTVAFPASDQLHLEDDFVKLFHAAIASGHLSSRHNVNFGDAW